jgi:hypothetical protein
LAAFRPFIRPFMLPFMLPRAPEPDLRPHRNRAGAEN